MRKTVEDSDLIQVIQKAKGPMTVDQIAQAVGSMRHKIAPQVRILASSGQIDEIKKPDMPVCFVFRQDSAVPSPSATVVNINHSGKRAEKPQPSRSIDVKNKDGVDEFPGSQKPVPVSHQTKASIEPEKKVVAGSADLSSLGNSKKNQILSMLASTAQQREVILSAVGQVEDLLLELAQEGLVESDYIINDHVYMLTKKALIQYPQLKKNMKAERSIEEFSQDHELEEMVQEAPTSKVDEIEPMEVVATEVVPASKAPESIEEEKLAGVDALDKDIVEQVTGLVNSLMSKRHAALEEEIAKLRSEKAVVTDIGNEIKNAANALQLAVNALNNLGDRLSQ